MNRNRRLLLSVLASTATSVLGAVPADAADKDPKKTEEAKPKPPPVPAPKPKKPCSWKAGNSKVPPCKDEA